MWLDLQIQILDAKWLQKHPDTWYKDAILESECFISKQARGKSNENPSQQEGMCVCQAHLNFAYS